jgi:hypothetical protein
MVLSRPVYEDERGQYVLDGEAEIVRGVWFIPREESDQPIIVSADLGF